VNRVNVVVDFFGVGVLGVVYYQDVVDISFIEDYGFSIQQLSEAAIVLYSIFLKFLNWKFTFACLVSINRQK